MKEKTDISIVLSGEAGQGLQTLEQLMVKTFKLSGYNIFSYSEFMSRIRGGNNSSEIRISSKKTASYVKRIDIFVPLHTEAMKRFHDRITRETIIMGESAFIENGYRAGEYTVVDVPLTKMTSEVGGGIYLATILYGIFAGLLDIEKGLLDEQVRVAFSKNEEKIIQKNLDAATKGYATGQDLLHSGRLEIAITKSEIVKKDLIINGADAIGIGALAGGCNFVSSYPMSPSTNVLVFFARNAEEFSVVAEQAEDEISAINMAIGAWYAGGRAMVTTSGGGFALMIEALSLAGCTESPLVIHLGQRPGPATGLPTRTEQADLEHALYSGHGEFPRVLLAPGSLEEGIFLARHAFYIADKYQVPVILLTDQYFLDSSCNINSINIQDIPVESSIVKTDKNYKRYLITPNGISPRGIPGFGDGLVCVDSDEHDEGGYITEDFQMRTSMVEKRLRKLEAMENDIIAPTLTGSGSYKYLAVSWGSTYNVVKEALEDLERDDIAFLHFSQVYPLHHVTAELIRKAERKIIIENNATSQFGRLIKRETGIDFDERLLKFNGMPFMLEEIIDKLKDFR